MGKVSKKNGFTLIETVVIVGIVGFLLPVIFAILFSILQQQIRIFRTSEVKRQGDYALSVISNSITDNATKIYNSSPIPTGICLTSGTSPYSLDHFTTKSNGVIKFFTQSAASILSSSDDLLLLVPTPITTNRVRVNNLTMECIRTAKYSPPYVNIKFDICYQDNSNVCPVGSPSLHYETKIKLKSY
jgi:type II secretory pathway pseudopilin PulG